MKLELELERIYYFIDDCFENLDAFDVLLL
jgi:hypothetical protein